MNTSPSYNEHQSSEGNSAWTVLIVLAFGFLALYIPSYFALSRTVWVDSEEMHGPIVLAVACWALFGLRTKLKEQLGEGNLWLGLTTLLFGLFLFASGKLLNILVLEIGSQVIVLLACALLIGGWKAVKLIAFPLVFLIFMVPLPGNLIDAITGSLKQVVSVVAEQVLYWAGYPIARSGVIITVGQYQLLVADACSGLKSLFSLSAVGVLYIYLVSHKNRFRNILLAVAIIPIAFIANVVRVIVLILVTYHFGDAAGQGFIHDFAGMALFLLATVALVTFDGLLAFFFRN
jgi:exosortase B